ncbi:MAG: hypothetical protein R3E14_03070 [Erythrobacter sp.]
MPQFFDMSRKPPVGELPEVQPGGAQRARSLQRLQIGITGVVLMVVLVGLASLVENSAAQIDAASVPEAAPTTEPTETQQQNDPLVQAGVVPDLPAPQAVQSSAPQMPEDVEPLED